jgi:VanZ family protein
VTPIGSRRAVLWAPVALLLAFEFYLSSQSVLPVPGAFAEVPQSDKLAHAAYFFLMGAMAVRAARFGEGWSTRRTLWTVAFAALAYGALDELHQSFVPMRDVEIGDVLADTFGGLMAGLFAEKLWLRAGFEHR